MSMIEEKIKKNRDLFDEAQPGQGHFDRFQSKLDSLYEVPASRARWYSARLFRVAAVIAVLLGFSVFSYLVIPFDGSNQLVANTLPREIQEAKMYYDQQADEKLQKINECAASNAEASYIQKVVSNEISLLDSNSVKLVEELQNDKGNKRLINALIRNYKTKSDLLDDILNRLCHI